AIYGFHEPLGSLLRPYLFDPLFARFGWHVLGVMPFLLGAGLASWGLALLSWHGFEKHCLKLKRYFAVSPRQHSPRSLAASAMPACASPVQPWEKLGSRPRTVRHGTPLVFS